MAEGSIKKFKFLYTARLWWKTTIKDTLAPLTDTNARLQFLVLLALIFLILPPRGYEPWKNQVINSWQLLIALIYALPISLVFNGFFAFFKVRIELNNLGQWIGNRFVYHVPVNILTTVVTDADNGKLIPFKIKGLHKKASFELIINKQEFDEHNVRVQFVSSRDMPIFWDEYNRSTVFGSFIFGDTWYITTLKETPSNASTVKVLLLSWWPPQ